MKGLGEVWYEKSALTNIVSWSRAKDQGFDMGYDNANEW